MHLSIYISLVVFNLLQIPVSAKSTGKDDITYISQIHYKFYAMIVRIVQHDIKCVELFKKNVKQIY